MATVVLLPTSLALAWAKDASASQALSAVSQSPSAVLFVRFVCFVEFTINLHYAAYKAKKLYSEI